MHDDLFVDLVQQRAGVDRSRAEALAEATMQALAEQVDSGELVKLTAQLPRKLKEAATPSVPHGGRATSLGELSYRVGELAGITSTDDSQRLPSYVRTVFGVLAEAVAEEELRPVLDQLPDEFDHLVPASPDRADPDAFLAQVQEHGGISERAQANTVTGVTLNLLADRISTGQARDLSPALPEGLRTYLKTNKKTPQSFDKGTMLDRVITATGAADEHTAERQVRAVFTTLRAWISQKQLDDTRSELPPEIAELFD